MASPHARWYTTGHVSILIVGKDCKRGARSVSLRSHEVFDFVHKHRNWLPCPSLLLNAKLSREEKLPVSCW
jgi:hypothetical protein